MAYLFGKFGMSNLGNTSGTSGTVNRGIVIVGGNNITLSQSINASSATLSISAANQTIQTQNLHNLTLSGNTAGVMAHISSGTLTLAGGNNVTLSQNGNAVTISAGAGGGGGIALANSQTTYTSGTAHLAVAGGALTIASTTGQSFNFSAPSLSNFSATGAVSLASNGNTISIGAPAFSAGISNLGNTSGTSGTASNQLVFAGGNNVTLSQSTAAGGHTVTISAANQSAQTANFYASSNTTQLSSSAGIDLRSVTFQGAGVASVGVSEGKVLVSVPAGGGGLTNINLSAGTTSNNLSNMVFSNSNGVSFGLNGSTVTASHNGISSQSNQNLSLYAIGNTTQNSSTLLNASNLSFGGRGAASIGYSNGSIQVSAPASSSLSATGGISISTNGSTISIGAQQLTTLSRWEHPANVFTSLSTIGQGSLSIQHMYVPFNITGTAVKIGGSLSASTSNSVTTASANISLWMGIYTLNGSTLSLASSGSANNGFQWSVSNSSTANTSINSMRQMTVPMNVNMTPGEYWMAAVISSQTTYTGAAFTIYGNNLINNAATAAVLAPIGSGTTAARDAVFLQGIYTAATAAGPTSMSGGHINNTSASNVLRANFYNLIYNATY